MIDSVSRTWTDGRPAYVVGGGPSLAPHVERLREVAREARRPWVLGVNRVAEELGAANVDATFSLDRQFAERWSGRLGVWARVHSVYLGVPPGWLRDHDRVPGVTYVERRTMDGLSSDPGLVANGLNSGYGALNLAVLKGARRVVLLGFDFRDPGDGPYHWYPDYEWHRGSTVKYFDRWADRFEAAARDCERLGVSVVNANPDSRVRAFPFTTYAEALG